MLKLKSFRFICRRFCAAPSALDIIILYVFPDLTVGPTLCRSFGPGLAKKRQILSYETVSIQASLAATQSSFAFKFRALKGPATFIPAAAAAQVLGIRQTNGNPVSESMPKIPIFRNAIPRIKGFSRTPISYGATVSDRSASNLPGHSPDARYHRVSEAG